MHISDRSSDVCSSDLAPFRGQIDRVPRHAGRPRIAGVVGVAGDEIEGAGCEGTDADLLLQKIELIAVIGPTVTPEDRKAPLVVELIGKADARDRKSTRLNSSH